MGGNYIKQPRSAKFASVFFGVATSGDNQAILRAAPIRQKADENLDRQLNAPFSADANDILCQWESSRDYNALSELERIQSAQLAINSFDDGHNTPELGILEREIKGVKNGRVLLIPGSDQTAGHGTATVASSQPAMLSRPSATRQKRTLGKLKHGD